LEEHGTTPSSLYVQDKNADLFTRGTSSTTSLVHQQMAVACCG